MSTDDDFLAGAAERYVRDTREALEWLLERPVRGPVGADGRPEPFVDTKIDPLTLRDYTASDGLRGPDHVYGWIQGRALEALCTHAALFEGRDAAFAARLDARSAALYECLLRTIPASGEAAFCRDGRGVAARTDARAGEPQRREAGLRTYSDVFVAKGLVAAAARHARPDALERHLAVLADCVAAIDEGRFLRDERGDIDHAALAAEGEEYGPRMILLGAAALLRRLGLEGRDDFSTRFVEHVLEHHLDPDSGLVADAPGGEVCNVGHGIELVGLALEAWGERAPPETVRRLGDLLVAHATAGFAGPGIALTVAVPSGRATSPYRPWWSLPETVRAAALAHEASGRDELLAIWRRADADYFERYRRETLPIAYQTLTAAGPVDHVPATPDLDPAYHTGLSLMGAVESLERRAGRIASS